MKSITSLRVLAACICAGLVFTLIYAVLDLKDELASAPEESQNLPLDISSTTTISTLHSTSSTAAIRVPIIIYHSVRPHILHESISQDRFDITPELLDQQLSYLDTHGYTVISMDTLASMIHAGTTSPVQRPVVLTFDDGWHNQVEFALPILLKHHAPATFYIFTHAIGRRHFMTWDDVRKLDASGMTIGSHTLTHPYLQKLTPARLKTEVFDSKAIIESHIFKTVTHFASPFGYTSPELVSILREAGYHTGRTTHWGTMHSQKDMLSLTGILVSDSLAHFERVVKGTSAN